jgi:hypothetical protein
MYTKSVQLVADLLVGNADALTSEIITAAPAPLGSDACKKDTCCTWKYVADEMLAKFKGQSFRCNNFARGAIRLGFHDAAGWQKGAAYGGADGSILLTDELSRPVNKGLEEIAVMTKQLCVASELSCHSLTNPVQLCEVPAIWSIDGRYHPDGRHRCHSSLPSRSSHSLLVSLLTITELIMSCTNLTLVSAAKITPPLPLRISSQM